MTKKKGRGIRILLALLVISLAAVAVLILWKQWEYSVSEEFYDGLRSAMHIGGIRV